MATDAKKILLSTSSILVLILLTPTTAFSSAMVTCLALSTADATCCWCCTISTDTVGTRPKARTTCAYLLRQERDDLGTNSVQPLGNFRLSLNEVLQPPEETKQALRAKWFITCKTTSAKEHKN
jgi:hypothetical protein